LFGGAAVAFSSAAGYYYGANCEDKQNMDPANGSKSLAELPSKSAGYSKWDYNWDKRALQFSRGSLQEKPTATRYLYLIRHGQYVTDVKDPSKKILTDLGRRQAAISGQRLKQLGLNYTRFIQSGLVRAQETAALIANELPDLPKIECDPLLNEARPCRPSPPLPRDLPTYKAIEQNSQIEAAFRRHFHRAKPKEAADSHEIIVCHANVIRYFVCRALQFPPEAWLRFSLAHGSITVVEINPNGYVRLRTLGDAGHIPCELVSYS